MPLPPMYLIQSLFIFLFGILPIVRSQDESVFTNPSRQEDRNWALGDTKVVSWKTAVPVYNVSLWQQSMAENSATSQGIVYSKTGDTDKISEFSWVVQLYGADLSFSNVFFFWVNRDAAESFTSPYFNITKATTTTTTATDSSSTTGVDTSATNTVGTFTNNAGDLSPPKSSSSSGVTADSADSAEESSELQTTGKVALGVGIGVGVPILGALFALVWLKMRQSKNTNDQTGSAPDTIPLSKPVMYAQQRPPSPPKEVKGSDPRDYYAEVKGTDAREYYAKEVKGTDPRDYYPELPANEH